MLRNKIFIAFVITALCVNIAYSWGRKGHYLINKKAVELLPAEMNGFKQWSNYIAEHASDPDDRKNVDSTEFPKHFIDIDFYTEFLNGRMIKDKQQLITIYGDSAVTDIGTLPWSTMNTYNNLIQAFKDKNRDRILIYATDLGHYVGDAHQPMHTILNYDGQLSGQKGIHGKYEWNMIDSNYTELENSIDSAEVHFVQNPQDYIFNFIYNSNSVAPILFDADKFASKAAGNRDSNEYFNLLWFRTNYITKIQFNTAVSDLASLIYTAWVNSGKPSFDGIN